MRWFILLLWLPMAAQANERLTIISPQDKFNVYITASDLGIDRSFRLAPHCRVEVIVSEHRYDICLIPTDKPGAAMCVNLYGLHLADIARRSIDGMSVQCSYKAEKLTSIDLKASLKDGSEFSIHAIPHPVLKQLTPLTLPPLESRRINAMDVIVWIVVIWLGGTLICYAITIWPPIADEIDVKVPFIALFCLWWVFCPIAIIVCCVALAEAITKQVSRLTAKAKMRKQERRLRSGRAIFTSEGSFAIVDGSEVPAAILDEELSRRLKALEPE